MKRILLERNLIHVNTVGMPSSNILLVTIMKGLTLNINPMYVKGVGKHLYVPHTFVDMKKFILERSLIHVSVVGKPSPTTLPNVDMKEFTLETKPVCVKNEDIHLSQSLYQS